ncbi:hypothetical protein [Paractinoplanes rishiriensis]|uniref:hypothetical protein n=1 Tax=Paractinoplanes rishiriensis TaxID=1050105 RepID=UPI0019416A5F|nr:hypothetical protein [Actinoplanes rishiriensis]
MSNRGPSAPTGWTADLTAPAGTAFRPAQGCEVPTVSTLRCTSAGAGSSISGPIPVARVAGRCRSRGRGRLSTAWAWCWPA